MRAFLEALIPRYFPRLRFLCLVHQGKSDLQKSIPIKLSRWREPGTVFVIAHDQDSAECHDLKEHLAGLCEQGGRSDTIVRIVCRELEAWYFGDPAAVAEAFGRPRFVDVVGKAVYRDPDAIVNPAAELEKLVPAYEKVSGSRVVGRHLDPERSRSVSFRTF